MILPPDTNAFTRGNAGLGFAIAAIAATAIAMSSGWIDGSGFSMSRVLYELAWWALAAVTAWWAIGLQGQRLALLGLRRPTLAGFGWGVAFSVLAIVIFGVCQFWLLPKLGLTDSRAHVAAIRNEPLWLTLIITLRAGVVEEWIFRFFAIGQLTKLVGGKWFPAIVSGLLFVALHAQDWQAVHLVPVALVTIVLTALYWWRNDMFTSAVAHFLTDFVPALLALMMVRHS